MPKSKRHPRRRKVLQNRNEPTPPKHDSSPALYLEHDQGLRDLTDPWESRPV